MSTPASAQRVGLRIGFVPGVTLTKWSRIWQERFQRVALELIQLPEVEQRERLDGDEVDMCFVRLPVDTDGLHCIRLYDEQPVVWMSQDFLLAALDEVTVKDLAEFRILADYGRDSIDLAVHSAAALRVPLSVARTQSRKDMVHRPVVDADPTTIALVWRTDNQNPWIDEFIGVVRGRTANSSRTVRERAATAKPERERPRKPRPQPRASGHRTRGRRRRSG